MTDGTTERLVAADIDGSPEDLSELDLETLADQAPEYAAALADKAAVVANDPYARVIHGGNSAKHYTTAAVGLEEAAARADTPPTKAAGYLELASSVSRPRRAEPGRDEGRLGRTGGGIRARTACCSRLAMLTVSQATSRRRSSSSEMTHVRRSRRADSGRRQRHRGIRRS